MIDLIVAVTLIRSGTRFVFQRKTAGYPLMAYVGQLCPVGGGWTSAEDCSPRDTAWRELSEEVRPQAALPPSPDALRFLGWFEVAVSPQATGARAYRTWNFVYEVDLPPGCPITEVRLTEGESAVVDSAAPVLEPFCWGYDRLLRLYPNDPLSPFRDVPLVDGSACRLLSATEPVAYRDLDLADVRVNPARTGSIDDRKPFQT